MNNLKLILALFDCRVLFSHLTCCLADTIVTNMCNTSTYIYGLVDRFVTYKNMSLTYVFRNSLAVAVVTAVNPTHLRSRTWTPKDETR